MRRTRRVLVAAATALAVIAPAACTAAPAETAPQETAPRNTDRVGLQRLLDEIVAVGAVSALAEVRDEHGVWRGASGVAERGTRQAVPLRGRFRVGSITKTFVATVVLQLVNEGRLRLDDTVRKWQPGAVPNGRSITVRHLLSHTSGLYDYVRTLPKPPPGKEFLENRLRTWTAAELIKRAVGYRPEFEPPGSDSAYSNTNYLLLGQIIEEVTGQSYGEVIERRIIRPLDLRGTSVPGTFPRIRGPHPHGYVRALQDGKMQLVDITAFDPSVAGASGEMISTTTDLNRFFAALLDGRLLPDHLLNEMKTPGVEGATYGLGLLWQHAPCGVRMYGHSGSIWGYQSSSFTTENGRRQVTLAIMPNFRDNPSNKITAFMNKAICG